jgi:hypothetical protein
MVNLVGEAPERPKLVIDAADSPMRVDLFSPKSAPSRGSLRDRLGKPIGLATPLRTEYQSPCETAVAIREPRPTKSAS